MSKQPSPQERGPKVTKCSSCGRKVPCFWGPNPYDAEINDHHTPCWLCNRCEYESRMAI